LRRKAHQLKGAAGSYGYLPITDMAARLENTIRESQPEEAVLRSLEELISMCRRVRCGADR
jgi:HPt (histidine-containing phosphotransfer) domain-containing protein